MAKKASADAPQANDSVMMTVLTSGYVAPPPLSGWQMNDPTPMFNIGVVERMLKDHQVRLGCAFKSAPIMRPKIEIEAKKPEWQEFIEGTIQKFWATAIPDVINAFWYTKSGGEVVYERDSSGLMQFREYREIHPLDYQPLVLANKPVGIRVKNIRGIGGVTEYASTGSTDGTGAVNLLRGKSFVYIHNRRFSSWYGQSDLEPAHKPWLTRADYRGADQSARLWYYKNAYGGGIITHPAGSYLNAEGVPVPYRELALQTAQMIENGSVIALENTLGPDGKSMAWSWVPASFNGDGKNLLEYIDHIDMTITRGIGIPDDVIHQNSGTGSYAGRTIPLMAFFLTMAVPLKRIFAAFKEQILDFLLEYNFGPEAVTGYTVKTIDIDIEALMPAEPSAQSAGADLTDEDGNAKKSDDSNDVVDTDGDDGNSQVRMSQEHTINLNINDNTNPAVPA